MAVCFVFIHLRNLAGTRENLPVLLVVSDFAFTRLSGELEGQI